MLKLGKKLFPEFSSKGTLDSYEGFFCVEKVLVKEVPGSMTDKQQQHKQQK